jgi:hypothetical protein
VEHPVEATARVRGRDVEAVVVDLEKRAVETVAMPTKAWSEPWSEFGIICA